MPLSIPTEYEEQCKVVEWARLMVETGQEPQLELLHGDSSGVRVPIGCAMKMKRSGAVKGWPDLFLPVYTGTPDGMRLFHGLFIELKRRKNSTTSREQKRLHELLRDQGFCVKVCKGADEAIACIKNYLGMK